MRKELSKKSLFLLGIIAQEPINPYTLYKLLSYSKRNHLRSKTPAQTVFSIIKTLHRQRFISGERRKYGLMPEMTVYSITKKGQEVLKRNLLFYISFPEDVLTNLVLSVILLSDLNKDDVLQALHKYRVNMEGEIATREKEASSAGEKFHLTRKIALKHIINVERVNLDTVNELIKTLEANPQFKQSPIPWWRDEFNKEDRNVNTSRQSDRKSSGRRVREQLPGRSGATTRVIRQDS